MTDYKSESRKNTTHAGSSPATVSIECIKLYITRNLMEMQKYDYLIVGAGLYGAMFAYRAIKAGKKCIVIDKNPHIGGFCYSENKYGIEVHKYGAHIFRTNSKKTWDFVNSICEFVPFVNAPIARYRGNVYNLPFNMNTFNQVFRVTTPEEAYEAIEKDKVAFPNPKNLEEYCLSTVGRKIYGMFIKDYTEKQWGKKCAELPVSIIKRIPIRYTFDNNYFNEKYQGIPECGYTEFIRRLLEGCDVALSIDYFDDIRFNNNIAERICYTGPIDRFFRYKFGMLDFRSVRFDEEYIPYKDNVQGNAVINIMDPGMPYTRIIEHKHFLKTQCNGTIISYETPCDYSENYPPSYPIHTEENIQKYAKYKILADKETNVIFGGRLAEYKYYNMNDIIEKFI